jgi:hypothetical protein
MGYFLDLPKHYGPGFNRVGAKPKGRLEIDWSNPLTRGLKLCFVDKYELVNGTVGVPVATNSAEGATLDGKCLESNSTTDGGWAFRDCGIKDALHGVTEASILSFTAIDDYDAWGALAITPANLTTWASPYQSLGFIRDGSASSARLHWAYSSSSSLNRDSSAGFLIPDGVPRVYAVGKSSGSVTFYRDGEQYSSHSGISNGLHIHHDNVYVFSRNDAATGEGVNGRNWLTLYWDRKLSAEEQRRLAENVYQILKVKQDAYFVSTDAGVSGSVSVTASSSVSTTGEKIGAGSVAVSASSGVSGNGQKAVGGSVSVSASSSVAADGNKSTAGSASVAQTGTVSVSGEKSVPGVVAVSAASAVSASGSKTASGDVDVAATSAVTVSGSKPSDGVVSVTASSSVSASGSKQGAGSVSVAASSDVAVSGNKVAAGSVSVSHSSSVTASGSVQSENTVSVSAVSSVSASGSKVAGGSVSVPASAVTSVLGKKVAEGSVSVSAVSSVNTISASAVEFGEGEYIDLSDKLSLIVCSSGVKKYSHVSRLKQFNLVEG